MFPSQTVKAYEAFYSNPSLSGLSRRQQNEIKSLSPAGT